MQKRSGQISKPNGDVATGVVVAVKTYPAGADAVVYAANEIGANISPITTDANGEYTYYAENDRYSETITGTGINTRTFNDILLYDPVDDLLHIDDLDDRVTVVEATVTALGDTVAPIPGDIVTLQAAVSDLTAEVAALTAAAVTSEYDTFTPVVYGSSSAGVGTYNTQVGYRVKVGNIVHVEIIIQWSAHTGTGNLRVSGLPFGGRSIGAPIYTVKLDQILTSGKMPYAVSDGIDDKIYFYARSASTNSDNEDVALTTSGSMTVTGMFIV